MDSIFDLIFESASTHSLSQCEDDTSKMKTILETYLTNVDLRDTG